MISVVYCTRQTKPEHKEHLIKSSGLHKHIEVIEIINNGESLTKAYNRGLKEAKNNIVVFSHDDLTVETKQWGTKLIKQFEKNPEYAIIGVAGSKNMPVSGRWWENPKKMYGRVAHTHEGKTWLSSYSEDLGHELEEVVVCDGVWFAVDKTRIKKEFNENVEGFHFYDVTFSFENHLKGAKVGITTTIRINHQSIGQTNDSWEKNRADFSETYQAHLPANVKKVLRKGEKLKVLIGSLYFNNYTGSELYVFELAKQLIKQGCDVTICSAIGNPLANMAKSLGIKLFQLTEPPSFKLGDGKTKLTSTTQGEIIMAKDTLYKTSNIHFDVLHLNHKPVTEHLLRLFPDVPAICSIHSEVINLEEPVISTQIKRYIAIRPEIKDYLVKQFDIPTEDIELVYNPIDATKFKAINSNEKRDKKRILFVGTIDYLRRETIKDLIDTTKENNEELWIVGKKNDNYLDAFMENNPHVSYFPPTSNIEKFIHQCDETAGILLGRTTIEGWLCGKSGWIYNVDNQGEITSKELHEVPTDIDKFKSENVAKEIIELYKSILD
jgi:glycosyltransferase involved in cell wall biosynthesis